MDFGLTASARVEDGGVYKPDMLLAFA